MRGAKGGRRWRPRRLALLGLCLCGWLLMTMTGCGERKTAPLPRAVNGVLNLHGYSFDKTGMLPLNGEWAFEWYGQAASPQTVSTIQVPHTWGGTKLGNGTKLYNRGVGVYKLAVLLDSAQDGLAIRLPNISTAYTLTIDGKPAAARGVTGTDAGSTTPYQLPETVFFDQEGKGRIELELRVANFDHRQGGIRTNLLMGEADDVKRFVFRKEAQQLIVFGCLIMIGIYHGGLFVLRRKEQTNLYFALLCLFVACRMSVIGDGLFFRWVPSLTWTAGIRIEYSSFALAALFGFAYYQRMYPQEIARRWLLLSRIGGVVLVAASWLLTIPQVSGWIAAYQIYVLGLSATTLAALVLSWFRRREGARLALIGVAGLVVTIVNDIFFYNGWWRSYDLVSFGLLFLILMNSFSISLRFSRTFVRVEHMSAELREWNSRLEGRIAERTEELTKSYADLEESKRGLERMEQARRKLISNISHDLRTPITLLQGYLEALRDGVITDPKQRDSTIRLMLTKVEGLNDLIQDLFDLSILEARRVKMTFEPVRLCEWLQRLAEEYEPELREKEIRFDCELPAKEDARELVRIDEHRMDRVFANLIYNAIRHTAAGGVICIAATIERERGTARIDVSDTGTGIHPDDLPHIFERFYKNDKSRHSSSGGSGLGLSIAREIVETHEGELFAANREQGGSVFTIRLPLCPTAASDAS